MDVPFDGTVRERMPEVSARAEVFSVTSASAEAVAAARPAAVVVVSRAVPITRTELDTMPRVRMVSAWGVGYNHIDVPAATARGIPVCINPAFARSMAEAGLTLILALSKNLLQHVHNARSGVRSPDADRGMEIRGKILGLVGLGRIGRELGDLARRLDMHVMAYDPYLPDDAWPAWCVRVVLADLLGEADFVVVTAPLTPETHHLIGANQLALMKSSAYLINIARGPLVDEAALLVALREERIAGAGIDVWEKEPVSPDHPLLALENVIGTPHRLGATVESLYAVCASLQSNILRVLNGQQPEHVVNAGVLRGGPR